MEKIIVAIRTLNDNLKIVATKVEELGERLDTLEKRVDGAFAYIDTCGDTTARIDRRIAKLEADTEARLAELTERVYALENATPAITDDDDIGDALDDIVGMEETPTQDADSPTVDAAPTPTPTPSDDDAETALDALLGSLDAPTTPTPAAQTPTTPTVKKTPAKTSTATSAVQRRAYARQYMVERGAKVEDLRSPAKIEEVMETEEFKTWVASR